MVDVGHHALQPKGKGWAGRGGLVMAEAMGCSGGGASGGGGWIRGGSTITAPRACGASGPCNEMHASWCGGANRHSPRRSNRKCHSIGTCRTACGRGHRARVWAKISRGQPVEGDGEDEHSESVLDKLLRDDGVVGAKAWGHQGATKAWPKVKPWAKPWAKPWGLVV